MPNNQVKHELAKRMIRTTQDHFDKKINDSEYEISLRSINNELKIYNLSRNEIEVYAINNRETLLKESEASAK